MTFAPTLASTLAPTLAPRQACPTVAVIGAGFSGLLTALHLLAAPGGPRVRLVERRPAFARGAAYSTTSDEHVLNVRAANMSAFPDRPEHFVQWLAQAAPEAAGHAFVTRTRYGAYLQAMLRTAAETAEPGRLVLEADAAVRLSRAEAGAGWTVELAMGRRFHADAAVLAVGNLAPHLPPGVSPTAAAWPTYFGEPWGADLSRLPQRGAVLLIGTGLTMVDVALRLGRERPGLDMLALSRRGLLPRRHLPQGPAPAATPPPGTAGPQSLLETLRARSLETDWRAAVDGLRPHVQALWRGWPQAERERFLRHLRPWWDVHRHRLAPAVADRLDELIGAGRLAVAAGRLLSVEPGAQGLDVRWRRRGEAGAPACELEAVGVVNCTGPNGDLTRSDDPLVADLAQAGAVRPDTCRLGLDVAGDGRLVARSGAVQPDLYAVGPTTRGAFWEITSVPDIRVQAAACAAALLKAPALA